jgi:hypothetical protein
MDDDQGDRRTAVRTGLLGLGLVEGLVVMGPAGSRRQGGWLRLTAIALAMVMSLGGCDWAMFGSDAARSRSNPESVVAPADRASMSTLFSAPTGDDVVSSPAVAGGVVYVCSSDDKLYAFDAMGAANCSPGVVTCQPLWTATTGARIVSSPAVAGGVVYVGSDDGKVYAFSAAGTTGCSGVPKVCDPLWTAATGGQVRSSPAVANGVVYVGSNDHRLYAFDAAGTVNCTGTPTTCTPLFSADVGDVAESSPAVANGMVYIGGAGTRAFRLP